MDRHSDSAEPTNDWPYIPESIVFEILSWVPAPYLVRYKTVCKQWRSWIGDPNFIHLHKNRARRSILGTTKHPNNSILLPPDGGDIFLWSKSHGRILGSSSCGLVCVQTGNNRYHIRNPATGKSFQLPPLESDSYVMEMRVYPIPQSGQFNVVAICKYSPTTPGYTFYWAVFTIGVDSEWRCVGFPMETDLGGAKIWWTVLLCESAPMYVLGKAYDHTQWKTIETFRLDPRIGVPTIKTAPFYLEDKRNISLQAHEWDGKFAISSIGKKEICTWILEDEETNKWRYETVIAPRKEDVSVHFVQQGKMWLRSIFGSRDLFSLDLATKRVEKITCNAMQIYDFEPYTATLETLEEMKRRPKRKKYWE